MRKVVLLLFPALLLTGCGKRESSSIDSLLVEDVYGGAIPVETLALTPQTFEDVFEAAGVIEAEEEVTVSAELADRILKVHYEIGDEVRTGALLVTLDDSEIRARIKKIEAQLERAKTQLEWARKDLNRQERLFATQVAAERAYDDASRLVDTSEDDLRAAEADLDLAQVELSRCYVRSPIDGQISLRHVAPGEYVREGTELYDIVATERVKFVFSLAERDVMVVTKGQPLAVRIDAFGDRVFQGPIRAISPSGAKQTRTFRVEIELANGGEATLRPGMSGRTEVVRERFADVFLLPEESIQRDSEGGFVYLANGEHARRAPVEILSQIGDKAVVSTAIGSQWDVIILGQSAVTTGDAIRVRRRHEVMPESTFD